MLSQQKSACVAWLRHIRSVYSEAAPSVIEHQQFYSNVVQKAAMQPVETLSLRQMLQFGRAAMYNERLLLKSARMTQRELPKRLARRLMDLQFLPHLVVINPHIKKVYDAYSHAFDTLHSMAPVQTMEQNAEFTVLLKRLVDDHAPMLDALAAGLRECADKPLVGPKLQLDGFLNNMLRSRISRRVLAEQHINLANKRPGFIGVVGTDINLYDAIDFAAQRAQQVSTETYGRAAEVEVTGDIQCLMPYIPSHLDYMLYELLKNAHRCMCVWSSCRQRKAVRSASLAGPQNTALRGPMPSCRISDQGGGIAKADLDKVWRYGYTTAARVPEEAGWSAAHGITAAGEAGAQYKMGGLGFGLPMSRLYAEYFGGSLQLISMPGYGVDAYLNLQRLEGDWEEMVESEPPEHHKPSESPA
eukprot:jgi/Astpho2/4487/e_gw1.00067.401.1_t